MNTRKVFFIALGIFSTMPVVTIPLGSRDISVFQLLFYAMLVSGLPSLFKNKVHMRKNTNIFVLWLFEALFACVCGWVYFGVVESSFSNTALSYIPKIVAYIILCFEWLCLDRENVDERIECILKGVLLGCVANAFWATIDGAGFYLFGKSINNIVFKGYIQRHNIRYGMLSISYSESGLFRAAGFNSDPAQIGFVAPMVLYYGMKKRKYYLVVISVLSILASASLTALVSSVTVLIISLVLSEKTEKKQIINQKTLMFAFAMLVVFIIVLSGFGSTVIGTIQTAANRFFDRASNTYLNSNDASVRWIYLISAPKALINLNIFSIFGTGFGTASYGYVVDEGILNLIGSSRYRAFDPENTYVAYLLDTGIIGFVLFLNYLVRLYKFFSKRIIDKPTDNEILIFSIVLSTILSMFFYHYILFSPQVIVSFIALMYIDNYSINPNRYIAKGMEKHYYDKRSRL